MIGVFHWLATCSNRKWPHNSASFCLLFATLPEPQNFLPVLECSYSPKNFNITSYRANNTAAESPSDECDVAVQSLIVLLYYCSMGKRRVLKERSSVNKWKKINHQSKHKLYFFFFISLATSFQLFNLSSGNYTKQNRRYNIQYCRWVLFVGSHIRIITTIKL